MENEPVREEEERKWETAVPSHTWRFIKKKYLVRKHEMVQDSVAVMVN